MVSAVSGFTPVDHASQPQPVPKPASNNEAAQPQDTVHLSSAGDVDRDGDSH